jgi:hypothetical protein
LLRVSGSLALFPIRPNPASTTAEIEFEIPFDAHVTLDVFDIAGNTVVSVHDEWMPAGRRTTTVDLAELPSGAYVAVLRVGLQRRTQRFVVRK